MKKHLATIILLILSTNIAACVKPQPTRSPISPLSPLSHPTWTPYPTRVPIIAVPGNLLIDPSLEGPYHSDGIHPEVNTSYAWKAWYSCGKDLTVCESPCRPNTAGCSLPCPSNCIKTNGACQADYGCYWMRPEYNPFDFGKGPNRVHSGNMAQVWFTYGRMGLGGIYQTVPITPGTSLRFTAWLQTWQCFNYLDCDGGRLSDHPSDMHLRIGIDPMGGTAITSTAIVWSPEQEAFDRWVQFSVTALAKSNKVTVFVQGGATFDYKRENNDVYVDDLALVDLAYMPPTVTPTATPINTLTPTPTATPKPTYTPGPSPTPVPITWTLPCVLTMTQRVFVLLPPNSTLDWYEAALPAVHANGWTLGTSAVDSCLNSCGGRVTIAINAQAWGCNLAKTCVPNCGNSSYVPLSAETPEDLTLLLERYPAWLHEARSFGACLPLVMGP